MKVPRFKQTQNACGPTALRMIMAYLGKNISLKEIIKGCGGIKKYGVRTIKLADFAKRVGFKVKCLSYNVKLAQGKAQIKKPEKKDILKYLKKNVPVILAVKSSLIFNQANKEIGHFIVVTKYQKEFFWYNDPKDGKQHKIKENDLIFAWYNNVFNSSAYFLTIWKK